MADAPAADYEAQLSEGQRWLNRTCENWIFAFLVAMAIRHFVVEAFRIPTASMEPMLYGDPGFLKGDHVVVDKLIYRFRGPRRWDVTVFQFPEPELEWHDNARPAVDAEGKRLDVPLLKPLMYRNFVKRMVIMPGDTFYIAGGDVYLKDATGAFTVARKPAAVQEALWRQAEIYRHGAQPGYLPWAASGAGCAVVDKGGALSFTLTDGGEVDFLQPFRNLYIKPGPVRVKKLLGSDNGELVEVAMTQPQFTYHGETGNIWNLDAWEVQRLTSADLDSGGYGRAINAMQNEFVGDVRLQATVARLDGQAALILRQGKQQGVRLALSAAGWSLEGLDALASGKPLAAGADAVVGKAIALTHLDDQYLVAIDGREVARIDVPAVDPNLYRLQLAVVGSGALDLDGLHLQRDVHYSSNWVLRNAAEERRGYEDKLRNDPPGEAADSDARNLREIDKVRRQFEPSHRDGGNEALACSPETAVTAPPGAYLMLGDNSPTSWDGRAWGWTSQANLRGRALAVVLPPTRWRVVR